MMWSRYCDCENFRVLMEEVSSLDELEKQKHSFYDLKKLEINEFTDSVEKFSDDCRKRIGELNKGITQVHL